MPEWSPKSRGGHLQGQLVSHEKVGERQCQILPTNSEDKGYNKREKVKGISSEGAGGLKMGKVSGE